MITLPISEKELNIIINSLKGNHPALYSKLWTYKMNDLNTEKNKNELSIKQNY
jgi:hypothetical protein